MSEAVEKLGGLNILVANAGRWVRGWLPVGARNRLQRSAAPAAGASATVPWHA